MVTTRRMMGTFKRIALTMAYLDSIVFPMVVSQTSGNILEVLSGRTEFSQMKALVQLAGLEGDLTADLPRRTVFAPTNDAFSTLPLEVFTKLSSGDWQLHLKSFLLNHIIGQEVRWIQLVDGTIQETLIDEAINITVFNDKVLINGAATVVQGDVTASNGVVHAIDNVLTPLWYTRSLSDVLTSDSERFSNLLGLETEAFISVISSPGPYTLFAPIDGGFDELDLAARTSEAPAFVRDVLGYHLVDGIFSGTDLAQVSELNTLFGGQMLDIKVNQDQRGMTVNERQILESDILTNNGVVHVIDRVLIPNVDAKMDECNFLKAMEERLGLESTVQCGCERIDETRVELTCTEQDGVVCAPKYAACDEGISCCSMSQRRCVGGQCRDVSNQERVKLSGNTFGGAEERAHMKGRESGRNLRG